MLGGGSTRYAACRVSRGASDRGEEKKVTSEHEEAARGLAERYWEGVLEVDPLLATSIGDERYEDRLPDPSEAGRARVETLHASALDDLAKIDAGALDEELQTTLDILRVGAERALTDLAFRMDRFNAVTHLFGPGNLLADIASIQRADTPERLEKYVARLAAIPTYMQTVSEVAAEAATVGQTVPALVAERAIAQVERLLALPPEDSPALAPVAEASDEDRRRVAEVVRERVTPGYTAYLEALREYLPFTRESIGLLALPDGEAMYASQIRSFTTLSMEAGEIHELGVRTLAEIQQERREIAERLGYRDADTAIAEHTAGGRNTARSRQEMVHIVEDQVRRSWEAAPRFFGRLPSANCEVKPVEEFREADMPGAYYQSPSMDGSRPGVYYVNTGGLAERRLHATATTSYHEANPGHHFQSTIEIEFADRLPLRRFGGWLVGDAFPEGWALYSERLADEMDLFLDDFERLGMLEAQGFRAGRLIVDTGIHAMGWSRERAVEQMIDTGSSRLDAEIEVDRYVAWPGQALAYMIGQLEIQRWRAEAAEREGPAFSLPAFHDRLLALGSLPLETFQRAMARGA
jgi:uncharacterized protein (DUF885 family)